MTSLFPHIRHRLTQVFFGSLITVLSANTAAAADGELFGTREIRSTNLAAFTKWTDMLSRGGESGIAAADRYFDASECKPAPRLRCENEGLSALIHDLQDKSRGEQMDRVNRFMNGVRYVTDDVNWGVADYWATPQEFLRRDGDCEDFAIAKYAVLRRLGFASDEMRIVVLEDQNLNTHHAILMVSDADGQVILDNQISEVVAATSIHHYKPVYSISEGAWWLHIPIEETPLFAEKGHNN